MELADRWHRFFAVYPYLIVYGDETKPLQIVHVLYAARDFKAMLGLPSEEP